MRSAAPETPSFHGRYCEKRTRLVIIGEQLCIAPPRRCCTQRAFRVAKVFELDLKPQPVRSMIVPFCEYAAYVCSKGHESEQVLLEESLSLIRAAMREDATCSRELEGSIFELSEFQDVKCLGNRKKVIDFQRERARQCRKLRPSGVGRRGQGLEEPADPIDRGLGQWLSEPSVNLAQGSDRCNRPAARPTVW